VMVTATVWPGPPEEAGATVTDALAVFVLSSLLIAVTVTDRLEPTVGAVYRPVELMVPTLLFPPVMPFTCHVTAVLEAPVTVAVNG